MKKLIVILTVGLLAAATPAAGLDYFEDFESYAPGSQLHGQGGWAGWDNAVAAGEAAVDPRPARSQDPPFGELLAGIDPRRLRHRLFATILADVVAQAEVWQCSLAGARAGVEAYGGALAALQGQAVQTALSHFPLDPVLRRFAAMWLESDPGYIKAMRRTGKALELPFNAVVKTVRWLSRRNKQEGAAKPPPPEWHLALDQDLLTAANRLYQGITGEVLEIALAKRDPLTDELRSKMEALKAAGARFSEDGRISGDPQHPDAVTVRLGVPAVLAETQNRVRRREWRLTLERILAAKEEILGFTARMDGDLRALAEERRQQMGWTDQVRQTFSAALNVLPATAAVTYILTTGDPVGAAGIKVKLAGIFGLHDLYALVAIPATAGLQKADMKQLEEMLGPVAQAWLQHKLETIDALFEEEVTGELRTGAKDAGQRAEHLADGIGAQLALLSKTG